MATSSSRREGPELPLSQSTLATTHPKLGRLGEQIIIDIQEIMEKGSRSFTKDDFDALTTRLPDIFNRVLDFVGTALATRGHYDNVAHVERCVRWCIFFWIIYSTVSERGRRLGKAEYGSFQQRIGLSRPIRLLLLL
jgi:hypothetical protein